MHAVVGSSGKIEVDGNLNHPVMYTSMFTMGSMVLDVSGNRLDATFLDSAGTVKDEFTIIKAPPKVVDIDVQPWDVTNMIKPSSDNPVPVAVLGMSTAAGDAIDFDASQVDASTARFGLGEAANIASPWVSDVDADTEVDMVLGFGTQDSAILCGDAEVSLTGETLQAVASPARIRFRPLTALMQVVIPEYSQNLRLARTPH